MPPQTAIQLLYPSAERAVVPVVDTPQQLPVPTSAGQQDVAGNAMSVAELLAICPAPEYEAIPGLRPSHDSAMAMLRTQRLLVRRLPDGLRLEGDTTWIGALLRNLRPATELPVEWLEPDAPPCRFAYAALVGRPLKSSWVEAHLRELGPHWIQEREIPKTAAAILGISAEGLRKRKQRSKAAK